MLLTVPVLQPVLPAVIPCSNTDTNQYNTDDGRLNQLLNTTRNNDQDIQEIKLKIDGVISSLSHIKETTKYYL